MADNFFCLDLGESYIKAVDVKKAGTLYEVKALGFSPSIPHFYSIDVEKMALDQADLISKLVSSLKINKKNVNVIIPDSISYSQIIEMPKLNEKELISAIKYQADQFIPMPLDKITLDIEILSEDKINKKLSVLIIAAPQDIINKVEKTVEMAGLVPQSVENELSATLRFINNIFKADPQGKVYIITNLGLSSTSLYLFNQKTSMVMQIYNFNIGYELFHKEIQQNLNIDAKKTEGLLTEIGFTKNASYNLDEILAPVLSSFIMQMQKFITAIQEKYNLKADMNLMINNTSRINGFDKKISDFISIPSTNFDIFPLIKNNKNFASIRLTLPLFIPTFGGNL